MAHSVPGPAGPPPLGPEGFIWTTWNADPTVVAGLGALCGAYAPAIRRRRRAAPGTPRPRRKIASFAGALLVLFGALTGPIHDLSDYSLLSAPMLQHMLLVFAMPPLLLYGTPGWMLGTILRQPRIV